MLVSTARTFKGFLVQARGDQGPATTIGSFRGLPSGEIGDRFGDLDGLIGLLGWLMSFNSSYV